jgi:hypothetical protein
MLHCGLIIFTDWCWCNTWLQLKLKSLKARCASTKMETMIFMFMMWKNIGVNVNGLVVVNNEYFSVTSVEWSTYCMY